MEQLILFSNLGALGSAIATPTDLVKVRQQGCFNYGENARYSSTILAFREIFQTEGGFRGLYVGLGPTVKRATILTATQVLRISQMLWEFIENNDKIRIGI